MVLEKNSFGSVLSRDDLKHWCP